MSSSPVNDKVDVAVARVVALFETLSPSSWTADQFDTFLTRLGDQCGHYLAVQQPRPQDDRASKTRTSGGSDQAEEEDEEEVTDKQAMEEVAAALERVRQHILKKHPYGTLDELTHRPYETLPVHAPGTKRARTELASETTVASPSSAVAAQAPVYAIDAYLYPEEAIEDLVASGHVCRQYCEACGSTEIGLADFITHSFSVEQLIYLSTVLLPNLPDLVEAAFGSASGIVSSTNTVVDVGSRLGVVLWSCYFSARAGLLQRVQRVVGVELSQRYCAVQRDLAKRFCARPIAVTPATYAADSSAVSSSTRSSLQLNVVESSCFEGHGAGALAAANVLILHNVFEYFCDSAKGHLMCWKQLRDIVAACHGQLWVTSPSLEETFESFADSDARELFPSVLGVAVDAEANVSAKAAGQAWLNSFLDPVDVTALAEVFVAAWSNREAGGDADDSHSACCEDSCHGGCVQQDECCQAPSDTDGTDERLDELKEMIGNIHVYRVR